MRDLSLEFSESIVDAASPSGCRCRALPTVRGAPGHEYAARRFSDDVEQADALRIVLQVVALLDTLALLCSLRRRRAEMAELDKEQRRERRKLRREKQRKENIGRAAKMHAARLSGETPARGTATRPRGILPMSAAPDGSTGSGGNILSGGPADGRVVQSLCEQFDTVEINASFYSWPTVANVKSWQRQPGERKFVYTVKVCELITHIKRFKGTKTLVRDFGMIADILGERMGCFLFQLPPSYHFTKARLSAILRPTRSLAAKRGGVSSRQLVERDGLRGLS